MPLIITPAQLTHRAELYHQLAQLTAAGITLMQSLGQLERHPPARSFRPHLRGISISLTQGHTLTDALRTERWLPEFDVALIEAGERSGRLDQCFRLLGEYYADRARMARQVIMDLLYPVALLHFAVFVFTFPFANLFTTGVQAIDLLKIVFILLPGYVVTIALIYACQSRHGETWRSLVEMVLRPLPVIGAARQYLALARLAAALEALIAAGVTIIEAWEIAAVACGSPGIAREVRSWRRDLLSGETPADKVSQSSWFPQMFANLYHSGEISGSLDDSLIKLRKYYQEEGSRKMHLVSKWGPFLIYFGVMMGIAYKIISFYLGRILELQKIMEP